MLANYSGYDVYIFPVEVIVFKYFYFSMNLFPQLQNVAGDFNLDSFSVVGHGCDAHLDHLNKLYSYFYYRMQLRRIEKLNCIIRVWIGLGTITMRAVHSEGL